jgi:outer membrane protein assembly factor BamB
MRIEKRKTIAENSELFSRQDGLRHFTLWFCVFSFSLLVNLSGPYCWAVTSKVTRHSSSADLLKGRTKDIVVGSEGTLQLGRAAEVIIEKFEEGRLTTNAKKNVSEPWSVNSIVVSGGTVYLGTSPNGGIYRYSLGKLTKIYPLESEKSENIKTSSNEPNDVNRPNDLTKLDSEIVKTEQYLANEHIFAMAIDMAGRLLAATSGDKCALYRFEADKIKEPEVIFEPNDAEGSPPCGGTKYIFAIAIDGAGNIYLGTGPQGKVYRLDSFGREPQLLYDSRDKNILSLAIGQDGFVYAGSDSRGLVYKINPRDKTATVLYDSDQPEITALLFAGDGNLYAAATLAEIVQAQGEFATQLPLAGRPEVKSEMQESVPESEGGLKLEIANTKKENINNELLQEKMPPPKPSKPAEASYIYKITKDGYVTDIFTETAVLFCLAEQEQKLLIGTGNNGRTFTVDPASEQQAIIYQDEQASQIAAVAVAGDDVYLGTANPAKLIKLAKTFAPEGTYTSDLIDADQPANWGKLQIDADIPQGCKVRVASRSGNVKDINDPTFSNWTDLAEVTEPVQLQCPLGRFCQYKLVLQTEDRRKSPLIREIAVADTVPNLAPKVESVSAERIESADKKGMFKISYKAKDDNGDKLIYKIDFRKVGRENWIELKKELETDSFEWDGRTVEDGRYEVRVTASDERSNTTTTKLTGSRITKPVVVDNTEPVIKKYSIESGEKAVTLKMQISDQLSAIGKVDYTVDSNAEWISAVPDDFVYDTTVEDFTIVIEKLDGGEHIIAVKASDDVGNTTHKTFEVTVAGS